MSFAPIPLTELLSKERIDELERRYTQFEKDRGGPSDLYLQEPSMSGAAEMQTALGTGVINHALVLQEMIRTKQGKLALSRDYLESLPAGLLMAVSVIAHNKFTDLIGEWQKEAEEALAAQKKD